MGLRVGGVVIREVGLANKWMQHANKPTSNISGPSGLNVTNAKGGPLPSRPPDLTRISSAGSNPNATIIQSREEARAEKGLEIDGASDNQSAAVAMEDVEMEGGNVGPSST